MWSGHFNFLIFVILFVLFFFFNREASSTVLGDGSIIMHKIHTHARILNSSTLLITSLIHQ